ncbi:RNA exonuclease 1 homolog [Spea bombifrons]|uniref:RNA exonuclease 1 homolog n=1 Tax=Spea bombifrons TaxID=233779 RepID=UPI00234A6541|nr:RNA exonuclease 1 homolog [Spea bombifrons]
MLKSTGYFKGIECPFGDCCRRPYCHFRHRSRAVSSSTLGEARNGAEYDPCSPEFQSTPPCLNDGSLDILELERVNKAIEEAKSEVEREQRKYEELLETQKDYKVPESRRQQSASFSPLEYDPGNNTASSAYNPTPLAKSSKRCKYTLDDLDQTERKNTSMEYDPTTVTAVPKYKTNKYVIDNSKPPTDMEYDPMSNYSARLFNKNKQQKGTKRNPQSSPDEGYSPSVKKIRKTVSVSAGAKFSESEDESELECPPSESKSVSSKKPEKASTSSKLGKHVHTEKHSRKVKETAVQCHSGGNDKPLKGHGNDIKPKSVKAASPKTEKEPKDRFKNRESGTSGFNKDTKKEKSKVIKKTSKIKNGENNEMAQKPKTEERKHEKKPMTQSSVKDANKKSSAKKVEMQTKFGKEKIKDTDGKDGVVKNGKIKTKPKSEQSLKTKGTVSNKPKAKTKKRSLSHVDLFGDESSEDEENGKAFGSRKNTLDSDVVDSSDTEGETSVKRSKRIPSPEIDYSALEKELDSDSDPMEECLRVFNESKDVKTEDKGRMGKQPPEDNEDKDLITSVPGQKRRISHVTTSTNSNSASKPVIRPYCRPTPQEICYQRIQRAQEQATQLLAQQKAVQQQANTQMSSPPRLTEKRRISLIPSSRSSSSSCPLPSLESKTVTTALTDTTSNSSVPHLNVRTLSGMSSKTTTTVMQKRKAHVPSLESASLKRPVIPTEFGAKVPTTVRQRYLNLFIDECLKFCPTQQEAFDKALEEEKVVYGRSSSRNIYLNVAVNTLKKLRNQCQGTKQPAVKITNKKAVSHESMLGGKLAAKTSFSMQRSSAHREEELTGAVLYTKMKDYILTPEQLQEHGYPLAHPDKPGRAMLFTTEEKKISDSSCKVCCRCGAEFLVSPSGNCVRREECVFHWGRLRRQRVPGGWETHYNCCAGVVGSTGCQVAKQHVQDNRKENLDGFVKTFEKLQPADGNLGVYALDCEMCYTTQGLELTRVTVINSELKVVYDTFVQPDNKIVDYNTRFSGVTEEDLRNTSITLRDVQAVLLCMFSSDTILIGHSLESDLFALRLIHPTVVDTAIVFPHRLGLPYKRALRSLMADHLKRIIQDNVEGHDSSEDACSCMELMIWKIKEDAKVKR